MKGRIISVLCSFITCVCNSQISASFTMPASICAGNSTTVTANTGTSVATGYTWTSNPGGPVFSSPNSSVTSITFPSAGNYTIILAVTNGTSNANASNIITVNPLPGIGVSVFNPTPICPPPTFIGGLSMSASGAVTYIWTPGSYTGANVNIFPQPSSSITYTITGTDGNGCVSSTTQYIPVYPLPSLFVSGPPSACSGSSFCMNASGSLIIYSWNGPCGFTSNQQNACPNNVGVGCGCTFTVGGSDINGCVNTKTICVAINPLPTLTASSTNSAICPGQPTTLNVNGTANTYAWSSGGTGTSVVVNPSVTTAYTVTGTNTFGCQQTATMAININPSPTLTISSSDSVLCAGQMVTLSVTGSASSYSWSAGGTSTSIAVGPTITTSYSVTGTNTFGCQQMTAFTQSVTICTGIKSITYGNSGISIFPNPTSNKIFFKNENIVSIELSASITDFLGREIKHEKVLIEANEIQPIDISKFPVGIYFLQVESQDIKVFKKIVKE